MKGIGVTEVARGIKFKWAWGELAGGVFVGAAGYGVFGAGSGFRVG